MLYLLSLGLFVQTVLQEVCLYSERFAKADALLRSRILLAYISSLATTIQDRLNIFQIE